MHTLKPGRHEVVIVGGRVARGSHRHCRLAQIKRRYDPDNVFHLNQNITPAVA